jgi:hypothetical protein
MSKEATLKELKDGLTALGGVEISEKEAQHLMVGAELKKAVGAQDTKDVYGGGPEEHGSPYKIEGGDKTALVGKFLRTKGYRPIGKNKWKRGVVLVELGYGKDKDETYIYVTDDNQE